MAVAWIAITGAATRYRKVNIILCILSNYLSELPLTIMCMDACFYTWLTLTGTFQESLLVRFFYYTNIITAIGLLYLFKRSLDVQEQAQKFLDQLSKEAKDWVELPGMSSPRFWQQLLNPFHWPRDCTIYPNIPYWTQKELLSAQKSDGNASMADMALDIYRPYSVHGGDDRPVLFYMHGGGWTSGSKKIVGPLLTEMIFREWIVVSVDYRLNSKAGYPTQLIDCKRALRWVKDEIRTFGGNPNNIIAAGDSEGGHMAAMIALTANQPEYQPDFENVDTTVQGCLGLSAVVNLVDLENYSHHDARSRFVKDVAKREGSVESAENLKFLIEHSPRFRIKPTGVPFMLVHGDIDTLAPVQNTRDFVNEFRKTATLTPNPVGGFAICQTASSFHIQGGVSFDSAATYLLTTNQHFRLDLSQPFDGTSSSPPVWANLTSDYSPHQRFHAGACTPDQESFLTVGNADAQNTGPEGNGFMMAYSVNKGTWSAVSQAVSSATNENRGNKGGKGKDGNQETGVNGAGRTMAGFAIGSMPQSGPKTALGVVVGGGWLPSKTMTYSAMVTDLTDLVTEADLISIGGDGSVKDLQWTVASGTGNGKDNVNTNLGPLAGAKIVIVPGNKAIILGGVTKGRGQKGNGMSFADLPVVDMASGSVTIQKTQAGGLNGMPSPRYGHCVALSADGNVVYMFGGAFVSNDRLSSELYGLDLRSWTWFQPNIKPSNVMAPPVRDHQCIVVGDQFMSFFGFNGNAVPASPAPGVSPPIYVMSTSSWMWSTRFTPLPGTPSPPKPPNVPTDGKSGKINGVAVGFGVVFGGAFLGVIGYLIYAHKRRQRRKAEMLVQLEMEQRKKEEEQLEKKRQKELQEHQDSPLPMIPGEPDTTHMYNANYYSNNGSHQQQQYQHQQQYQQPYNATYPTPPQASVPLNPGSPYYQAQNPFQNPGYYQPPQQPAISPLAPNPYYASASQGSTAFVPEEMGYTSPTMDHSQVHPGHYRGP
ncbi:hypothetical protein BGZ51_008432 [Haplosporangium sp. Z 767]|nr:hypothetical protein BGZ51_008432 [Haplosporangium sp. Z 767]